MTTLRQAAANRRNAIRSTGPRTMAGKAAVRRNALTHGLRSEQSLIPGEDPAEYQAFSGDVRTRLAPLGELERALTERIISLAWRLRRVSHAEAAIFTAYLSEIGAEKAKGEISARQDQPAITASADAVTSRNGIPPPFGVALIRDAKGANALGKVARYEIGLERSLYATLRELRGLQAERIQNIDSRA